MPEMLVSIELNLLDNIFESIGSAGLAPFLISCRHFTAAEFNLAFAEIKNLKNSNLILLIILFLGLFFGSIYVLINKSLRRDYQG